MKASRAKNRLKQTRALFTNFGQAKVSQAINNVSGVTHFRWITRRDDRVRDSHKKLHYKVVPIGGDPQEGYPGEAWGCRCIAEPIIPTVESQKLIDAYGIKTKAKTAAGKQRAVEKHFLKTVTADPLNAYRKGGRAKIPRAFRRVRKNRPRDMTLTELVRAAKVLRVKTRAKSRLGLIQALEKHFSLKP
jgi:hypothetical protein